MREKKTHPLFATLFSLKGTPAVSIYTEPLWGIPYNLYVTYASLYMLALGLNEGTDRPDRFLRPGLPGHLSP